MNVGTAGIKSALGRLKTSACEEKRDRLRDTVLRSAFAVRIVGCAWFNCNGISTEDKKYKRLSVYLIKETYTDDAKILPKISQMDSYGIKTGAVALGTLYLRQITRLCRNGRNFLARYLILRR